MIIAPRFWAKVEERGGCWIWIGAKGGDGYGTIKVRGHKRKAHRVAWHLGRGPIPEGLHVLHRCDTPLCVRVDHLFLGTNAENMADMVSKGRQTRGEARAALNRGAWIKRRAHQ